MSDNVRVRFAPSPTGYLHVGGARTALFNYLFAKNAGGTFILRIEDTDRTRFEEGALDEIFESLKWLGLDWDEGPEIGGDKGPYVQSERTELYKAQAEKLIAQGHAYRCFCTSERLAEVRKEREKNKMQTSYDRHCRSLSEMEAAQKVAEGIPHVVRLKVPDDKSVQFDDLIRGAITYETNVLDDLVLLKTDGFPTYHLANVVDDHHMGITHVLRGDEWIASTPRHVLIYEACGWDTPAFAHLPVILSPDGGKLSKRKGAASVMDYKRAGYLPEALFNFLSLLGWSPGDDREKMTRDEIIQAFELDKVSPKASVLDEKKLEWMNGLYMADRSVESLLPEVTAGWREQGLVDDNTEKTYLETVVGLMKDRSKRIVDLIENSRYFFADPDTYDEKGVKKHFKGEAVHVLETLAERLDKCESFEHDALEDLYRRHAEENGLSGGKLIHPTRLAISGVTFGPGLFELMVALGKENVLRRMRAAITWLRENS